MDNAKFIRPQHIARLFYSNWDGAAWGSHVEITDTFLNDTTKPHVGSVSGLVSLADDLVEKDRFIIYYGSYINGAWTAAQGTIDAIALAGLTQATGMTLKTYADDSIALGSVPTTLIDTQVQSADTSPLDTKNELIQFTETTKNCFMVERQGVASYNVGSNAEITINSQFITADLTGWTSTGTVTVTDSTITAPGPIYAAFIAAGTGNSIEQNFTFGSSDVSFKLNLFIGDSTGTVEVNGASTSYVNETINDFGTSDITFDVPAAETSLQVKLIGGAGGVTEVIAATLTATSGPLYLGSPLDTEAIIFGGDAFTPAKNFNNGFQSDDSRKYDSSNSGSRGYLSFNENLRSEVLQYEGISKADKNEFEHIDKTLSQGLCIYQRDGSSADTEDWFIGRLNVSPSTGSTTTENNITVTLTELVARD